MVVFEKVFFSNKFALTCQGKFPKKTSYSDDRFELGWNLRNRGRSLFQPHAKRNRRRGERFRAVSQIG
jgi:hypothetical protein